MGYVIVAATPVTQVGPTAPTAPVTPTFTNITQTSATVNWTAATDAVAVTGYEVKVGSGAWTDAGNSLSLGIAGLLATNTYTVQVRAYNGAGMRGPASSASLITSKLYLDVAFGSGITYSNRSIFDINDVQGGGWWDWDGTDALTGAILPPEGSGLSYPGGVGLWGGKAQLKTSVQLIARDIAHGGYNTDQTRSILTGQSIPADFARSSLVTGNLYRNTLVNPYVGRPVGGNQNDLTLWPDTSIAQGMVYIRKLVFHGPGLHSRMLAAKSMDGNTVSAAILNQTSASGFFITLSCKTSSSSARVQLSMTTQNNGGVGVGFPDKTKAHWQVDFDGFTGGTTYKSYKVWAIGPSPYNPTSNFQNGGYVDGPDIPENSWVLVEGAFRQVADSTGFAWFAINGTVIFSYLGQTLDPSFAGEKINRLFPHSVYTNLDRSSGSPWSYDLSHLQVWSGWAPDATTHPAVN